MKVTIPIPKDIKVRCPTCGRLIHLGDLVVYIGNNTWRHASHKAESILRTPGHPWIASNRLRSRKETKSE